MNIPHKWREQFPHALIEQQAIGESRADVFRLRHDGGTDLFLKSDLLEEHSELADEIDRQMAAANGSACACGPG